MAQSALCHPPLSVSTTLAPWHLTTTRRKEAPPPPLSCPLLNQNTPPHADTPGCSRIPPPPAAHALSPLFSLPCQRAWCPAYLGHLLVSPLWPIKGTPSSPSNSHQATLPPRQTPLFPPFLISARARCQHRSSSLDAKPAQRTKASVASLTGSNDRREP
jgi:hypothetical protein